MPRRGENIYKRKDGRWEARYIKARSPEGKAIYGYLYADSYRSVKMKLQQCKPQLDNLDSSEKTDSGASSITFRAAAEKWISYLLPQIKISTANKYRNLLKLYIYPRMADKPLDLLTHAFLEDQCHALLNCGGKNGTGLSPKTVSDILSVIRNVLKFAIKTGEKVSCDGRNIQIKQSAGKMRVLSRNEQEQLLRYLIQEPDEYNIGIIVCMFTGLRIGEVCALKWEDISITEQTIHVHHTMQRVQNQNGHTSIIVSAPKSACSVRSIPIPDELLQIITAHGEAHTGYFLTGSERKFLEPRSMQNHFKRALTASNVSDANFHALRHTFATRCIEAGFDVKSLSEILGHASVNITMNRYVHPSMELKRENMKRLSSLFAVK